MMVVVIKQHLELILANRLAGIRHRRLDLGPGVHAIAVVVPLVAVELERALAVAPRLDAELALLVAVVAPYVLPLGVIARELAAGGLPAVFAFALCAGDALVDGHG